MTLFRFLLLLFLYLLPLGASSQFIFQNLRSEDGLSAKQVRCLFKDQEGFLWIGAPNGLNRFDGAVIKQYKKPKGELDIFINALFPHEDQNKLLVGTTKGIRVFNKKTGEFTYDRRFHAVENKLIEKMHLDGLNRLWIVSQAQIYILTGGKLAPVAEVIPAAAIMQNTEYYNAAFVWDPLRFGFWVGGQNAYFIDCKLNEVYHKGKNPLNAPLLSASKVKAIVLDRDYKVWYGIDSDASLNFWDYRTGKTEKFLELDGTRINGGCNHLFVDQKDRLWISTWLFASYLKEPGKAIRKIPYSQNQIYSIGYGFFRDVIEDKEGNIWFGTINGVSKSQDQTSLRAIYKLPSFKFYLETGFANANSVKIDGDKIIACKEEGVVIYNMSDGKYKRYTVTDGPDYILNRFLMAAKHLSTWWFAGEDGVFSLAKGSGRLKKLNKVTKKPGRQYANIIFADAKGRVWFHIREDALYRYDPETGKSDRFDGSDGSHGTFSYSYVESFVKLRDGNLLFSLRGTGILKFDLETDHFSEIIVKGRQQFRAFGMAEDGAGKIWAAEWGKGIVKINTNGEILDSVNTRNGLLSDHLHTIGIDSRGAVWGATREGLMFFSPETRVVTRVVTDLGQNLQDYWNDVEISNDKVYGVMLDHVVVFDPLRFAAIPVKGSPNITSINILQEEKLDYESSKMMELGPDQNVIAFHYASLHHRDIPSLIYSYQLEGVDKNWIVAGRSLVASYNSLPPGHYVFKVRSTNEYGRWMSAITRQSIYIRPFWWQTWWAVFIYCAVILAILGSVYKSLQRQKQKGLFDKTIDYFANSVYGENSVNEICWDIARNCISQLQFEDCVVYLVENGKLVQKAAYGPKNPKGHEINNPIELEMGAGIVGTVAATCKALIISDTSKDNRYVVDDVRRLSEITVPIMHEGKVIGVIDSEHHRKDFFTENHLKALSTIASISANKIAEALAEAQAQTQSIQLLEINKMLAESQLMALRAQMNPHFVFNCLNSIQECIVTEKYGEASKYLNKFSKLFRMILNNSGKNLVTIQEERDVLELYLQLEQMRFERSFSYQIVIDENLDADEILIPSMLIQPYVENALWHGLMHATVKGELIIAFDQVSEEVLECRIEDNGIGRRKSFELRKENSKSKRHESKGLQITQDRLDLLQRQGQHAQVIIKDKYDENDNGTGTLITIELSTFLKNF